MMQEGNREMQEKALMYQILNAQLEELSSHFVAINNKLFEFEAAKSALEDIGKAKEGSEILVPVGGGCYGFGKLSNGGKFMVEIGAGLVEEKPLQDAVASVGERKKEIENLREKALSEIENIRGKMDRIGLELNEASAAAGAAAQGAQHTQQERVTAAVTSKKKKSQDDDEIIVE